MKAWTGRGTTHLYRLCPELVAGEPIGGSRQVEADPATMRCRSCAFKAFQRRTYVEDDLGQWTDPPRLLQPCGTHAAYNRHRARGEDACDDCKEAERVYTRAKTRQMRARRRRQEAA